MRWALFPALAALAGAVGGGATAATFHTRQLAGFIALSALLSAGGALGAALSTRIWVTLLCAPFVGLLTGFMSYYGVVFLFTRDPGKIWNAGATIAIFNNGNILPLLGVTVFFQIAAHAAALLPRFRAQWIRPVAFYMSAAAFIWLVGFIISPLSDVQAFASLASSVLFQVVPLRLSYDLARRLRRPEAA